MAEKRGSSRGRGSKDEGEHLTGADWHTALIEGDTFAVKAVQYTVVDNLAIFEGDIVLGTPEEVEARSEIQRQVIQGGLSAGVLVTGANRRWPNCQVPYDIDGGLTNQARVTDAIAHWQATTRYRFIPRSAANVAQFPDYVTFRPGSGCSSMVGKQGGQQFVNLGTGCSKGNVIHEIGHTIGLWHEQSREDRDAFVTIHWDKIQAAMQHNFDQHIADGDDVGPYDYGSIMHYPRDAFSSDGSDTITPIDPSAAIGQRTGLSPGDIAAANSICPAVKLPTLDPTIKEVAKDPIRDPGKLPPRDPTIKEVPKDAILDTIKERVRDTIKEGALDPKGPFDPGSGTFVEQPGPFPGPTGPPLPGPFGGPVPFAVATGHQAPALGGAGAGGMGGGDPMGEISAIDAQLQQMAEALGRMEADRGAVQQQYDELAAALAAAIEAAGGGPAG